MRRKILLGLGLLLTLLLLLTLVGALWLRRSGLPERSGERPLDGLRAEASIRWDDRGIPHIRAQDEEDLAAAQGWAHANDRMVQMELGRRAASGRLSEILGAAALQLDVEARTLRLSALADELWAHASPHSRVLLEAYARGVNAWLASRGTDLPPELRILGVRPGTWKPLDSLAFALLMARDLSFWRGHPEEERFLWLRTLGADGLRQLLDESELHIPEEIEALAASLPKPSDDHAGDSVNLGNPGSNNWALGPSQTRTGHALLANDPHLALFLPTIWYQIHLRSPTYEAAGMSIPGAPGVVIGRGPHVAWAFTNTMLDDHDLFFERLDESGERYLREDGWHPVDTTEESIPIRGGGSHQITLRSTDRGPLLEANPQRGLPPRSLRWTVQWGGDPLAAFLSLARAHQPEDILAAIGGHVGPAQNLVAAFEDGRLLFTVLGRVPDRRPELPSGAALGRLPSPGWNSAYGWQGLRPQATNPTLLGPDEDRLVTANHDIRPGEYALPFAADFFRDYRAERIAARLAEGGPWDLEGMRELQMDVVSPFALEVVRSLSDSLPGNTSEALEILRRWDGQMAPRGPAALYALVERELLGQIFGDESEAAGLPSFGQRGALLRVLQGRMGERWFDVLGTAEVEGRTEILQRVLKTAYQKGQRRWGQDVRLWPYAELHTLTLRHPLDPVPFLGSWLRRGPFELPGSATTVAAFGAQWRGDALEVVYGPSMRWVVDWSTPEKVWAALPGGQSGHPGDVHYADRLKPFLEGQLDPAPWSEEAIAEATRSTLRLVPVR